VSLFWARWSKETVSSVKYVTLWRFQLYWLQCFYKACIIL
jgi:hypothetical protein